MKPIRINDQSYEISKKNSLNFTKIYLSNFTLNVNISGLNFEPDTIIITTGGLGLILRSNLSYINPLGKLTLGYMVCST